MKHVLFDETPVVVSPTLAAMIGLSRAVFLQQVHYWLQKSDHARDGRTWVYNSYEDWSEQLFFLSVRTLKRIVEELVEDGILITNQYNVKGFDRTLWYSIDYDRLNVMLMEYEKKKKKGRKKMGKQPLQCSLNFLEETVEDVQESKSLRTDARPYAEAPESAEKSDGATNESLRTDARPYAEAPESAEKSDGANENFQADNRQLSDMQENIKNSDEIPANPRPDSKCQSGTIGKTSIVPKCRKENFQTDEKTCSENSDEIPANPRPASKCQNGTIGKNSIVPKCRKENFQTDEKTCSENSDRIPANPRPASKCQNGTIGKNPIVPKCRKENFQTDEKTCSENSDRIPANPRPASKCQNGTIGKTQKNPIVPKCHHQYQRILTSNCSTQQGRLVGRSVGLSSPEEKSGEATGDDIGIGRHVPPSDLPANLGEAYPAIYQVFSEAVHMPSKAEEKKLLLLLSAWEEKLVHAAILCLYEKNEKNGKRHRKPTEFIANYLAYLSETEKRGILGCRGEAKEMGTHGKHGKGLRPGFSGISRENRVKARNREENGLPAILRGMPVIYHSGEDEQDFS